MNEVLATPIISGQNVSSERQADVQDSVNDGNAHDSDDELMVYVTPIDYVTSARQERDRLISEGADPSSVLLESELSSRIPRREDESQGEYAKRYSKTMNAMIRDGATILNDTCTADVVASRFSTGDGRVFDLGPGSGATKGEFREFSRWFPECLAAGQVEDTPERWLKFQDSGGRM